MEFDPFEPLRRDMNRLLGMRKTAAGALKADLQVQAVDQSTAALLYLKLAGEAEKTGRHDVAAKLRIIALDEERHERILQEIARTL